MPTSELFELERALPDDQLAASGDRLIGFTARYERLERDLRLLVDIDGLEAWSKTHYNMRLPLLDALADRYPLVVFHGDVGTGKTATAEATAARLAATQRGESMLFKLSTRVRGSGKVGEMSHLINKAFTAIVEEAGKTRTAYLILDEADSLTASRAQGHSHHEDKVAVNTLIQKIDDLRRYGGRILVFLCTNRFDALDAAILRRALRVERFDRPGDDERRALFQHDLAGIDLDTGTLNMLVELTGPNGANPGYTFSDLRTRLLPNALARAFPDRPLAPEDLLAAAKDIAATPWLTDDHAHTQGCQP